MTNQYFVAAVAAVLLLGAPAKGQSAADLLQKGIHAQETVGDVDGAIQIFRQVAASPTANKVLAAQAQYQLVVCMLQKGDRAAARKELDLLARNFPDQADLATAGGTRSNDFPIVNSAQASSGGKADAFAAVISADGSRLTYSTYVGGSGDDGALGVAVDAQGNVILAGQTRSEER